MCGHGAGSPTPVASPKIPLRVTSATESLGALITRKIHRHHWPFLAPLLDGPVSPQSSEGMRGFPGPLGRAPGSPLIGPSSLMCSGLSQSL